MGGAQAPTTPEEGIETLRSRFAKLTLADSGKFLSHDGGECEW
jgi:hypothetical protein